MNYQQPIADFVLLETDILTTSGLTSEKFGEGNSASLDELIKGF